MKTIQRQQALDDLRAKLLSLTDDEHCTCLVAARLHIYCGGFSQWKYQELKERYGWIVKNRAHVSRPELEDLANRWQLARQFVQGTELACDTQTLEHHTCKGWDGFSDQDLARFYHELLGEAVEIAPQTP
jgi:hypothetical protein